MIVYEASGGPAVRLGEAIVAGRRLAGPALSLRVGERARPSSFDPVDRRSCSERADALAAAGPGRVERWREAARPHPAGPVLIGPPRAGGGRSSGRRTRRGGGGDRSGPAGLPARSGAGGDSRRSAGRSPWSLCSWGPGPRPSVVSGARARCGTAGLACGGRPVSAAARVDGGGRVPRGARRGRRTRAAPPRSPALVPAADGEGRRAHRRGASRRSSRGRPSVSSSSCTTATGSRRIGGRAGGGPGRRRAPRSRRCCRRGPRGGRARREPRRRPPRLEELADAPRVRDEHRAALLLRGGAVDRRVPPGPRRPSPRGQLPKGLSLRAGDAAEAARARR